MAIRAQAHAPMRDSPGEAPLRFRWNGNAKARDQEYSQVRIIDPGRGLLARASGMHGGAQPVLPFVLHVFRLKGGTVRRCPRGGQLACGPPSKVVTPARVAQDAVSRKLAARGAETDRVSGGGPGRIQAGDLAGNDLITQDGPEVVERRLPAAAAAAAPGSVARVAAPDSGTGTWGAVYVSQPVPEAFSVREL